MRTKRQWMRVASLMVVCLLAAGWGAASAAGSQPPAAGQQEFVPVDQLPQPESLPAAPLVIGAYAFVWVALIGYLWSVRRRLDAVERDLAKLARVREAPPPDRRA